MTLSKKILVVFFVFVLLFSLVSCSSTEKGSQDPPSTTIQATSPSKPQSNNEEDSNNATDSVEESVNKFNDVIEFGTPFSDGMAFIKVKGEDNAFCIDKNGNILFEIPNIICRLNDYKTLTPANITGFYHGITLISDPYPVDYITICDKAGKLTTAEDLGVSYFLADAVQDGYIITFTESEGKELGKIGVLDANLNWIIQPSSDISSWLGVKNLGTLNLFYYNYILYGLDGSINIQSGEQSTDSLRTTGKNLTYASESSWIGNWGGYYDGSGNALVDFRTNPALSAATADIDGAHFCNGKAPVVFYSNAGYTTFSLIDTASNMQFDPVDFGEDISYIQFDGNYILVVGRGGPIGATAKTYDVQGNLVGIMNPSAIMANSSFELQEGIVRVSHGAVLNNDLSIMKEAYVNYYDSALNLLY